MTIRTCMQKPVASIFRRVHQTRPVIQGHQWMSASTWTSNTSSTATKWIPSAIRWPISSIGPPDVFMFTGAPGGDRGFLPWWRSGAGFGWEDMTVYKLGCRMGSEWHIHLAVWLQLWRAANSGSRRTVQHSRAWRHGATFHDWLVERQMEFFAYVRAVQVGHRTQRIRSRTVNYVGNEAVRV